MSQLQPNASIRHLTVNRYPMCSVSLSRQPGLLLRRVSPVIIDTSGTFPFLLFRLKHEQTGLVVHCVRGSASFPSDQAIEQLYKQQLGAHFRVQVFGGGTIRFDDDCVRIFGKSKAFGRADHHVAGKLVKFCYPGVKVQYEPDGATKI